MGSLLSECQRGSGSRVTFGAAVPAAAPRRLHAPSQHSIHSQPAAPLTALAALGQQHKGGEGLQAKLVGSKLALGVGLELGHRHLAARHLARQLSIVALQALQAEGRSGTGVMHSIVIQD